MNDLDHHGLLPALWRCRHCGRCLARVTRPPGDREAVEGAGEAEVKCHSCGRVSRFSLKSGAPVGLARRRHGAAGVRPPDVEPPEGPAVNDGR